MAWRRLHVSLGLVLLACSPEAARVVAPHAAVVRELGAELDDDTIDTAYGAFDPLFGAQLPWEEGAPEAHYHRAPGMPARADYLAQFHGAVGQPARDAVQQSGAQSVGYFPQHALVVAATEEQAQRLADHVLVRAVVPVPPLLRVHPSLFALLPGSRPRSDDGPAHLNVQEAADVLVEVDDFNSLALVQNALLGSGSTVVPELELAHATADDNAQLRAAHVRLDAAGLGRLGRMAEVVAIAPFPTWSLLNERSAGLVQSGTPTRRTLQRFGLNGERQVVAVADTGLDEKSCYFRGAGKVVAYQHFVGDKTKRGDDFGHGTHVAGSIAGEDKKGRYSGVAPKAGLVVQQCAADGKLLGLSGNPALLLSHAYSAGAFVHANSWGIAGGAYTSVVRAVDRFVDQHPEMVMVAAVGNTGEDGSYTVHGPASAKNVVAVGASIGQEADSVAWFSSQGPAHDGRIKPTVLAPGVAVTSARRDKRCETQVCTGTSMAAPMVAGGVALLRQYFTEGRYPTGRPNPALARLPSAALLKAVLLVGAEPITKGTAKTPVPDVHLQGFGKVRLDRSLGLDGSGRGLWVSDQEAALDTGEGYEACFDVAANAELDVALSWTDPPPRREGAAVALTHNLDLELIDAAGHRSLGNASLPGMPEATVPDVLNVEEVIRRRGLPAGTTCVRVLARQSPERPQAFALAVLAPGRIDVHTRRLTR